MRMKHLTVTLSAFRRDCGKHRANINEQNSVDSVAILSSFWSDAKMGQSDNVLTKDNHTHEVMMRQVKSDKMVVLKDALKS